MDMAFRVMLRCDQRSTLPLSARMVPFFMAGQYASPIEGMWKLEREIQQVQNHIQYMNQVPCDAMTLKQIVIHPRL